MMKKYEWILFDADETLFHFDSYSGLKLMFKQFNIDFTQSDFEEYQFLNKALWVDYQNRKITAEQLQSKRFAHWGEKLQQSPHDLNHQFLTSMLEVSIPIAGAIELLHFLKHKAKLGIITNGFTAMQQKRLERNCLNDFFELLVVSEEVGVAKPHIEIFEHAFSIMGNPDPKNVLMVGDTLETDILGGMRAGMDTCWLNGQNKTLIETINPSYQVTSLNELEKLLDEIYGK